MMHGDHDHCRGEEGEQQPQIILIIQRTQQHQEQDASEYQPSPGRQDIDGPRQYPGLAVRRQGADASEAGNQPVKLGPEAER